MIWLGVAAVIVVAAAALLIWIIAEAIAIKREAIRALAAARLVETRTLPLWAILDVNNGLRGAVATTLGIYGKAEGLADALYGGHRGKPDDGQAGHTGAKVS